MSSPLDDYLKELTDQGTVDSQGVFTLDLAKAFEKLQRFRLARPSFYLLKFVQAAVAARSSRLEVTVRADLVDLSFELDHDLFDDVGAAANLLQQPESAPHGPIRHLVLGLSSALGVAHASFLWSVIGPNRGQVLMIEGQTIRLSPPTAYAGQGRVRRCRFMLVRRAVRMMVTADDARAFVSERDTIKERCCCAPLALFLNGELLQPPAAGVDCLAEERVSAEQSALGWPRADLSRLKPIQPGLWVSRWGLFRRSAWCRVYRQVGEDSQRLRSVMRLRVSPKPDGIFYFVVDGVLTHPHYLRDALCETWLVADGLKTDLSGLEVVEDEAYELSKANLRQRCQRLKLQAFAHAPPRVREFLFNQFGRGAHPMIGMTLDDLLLVEPIEHKCFLAVDIGQQQSFRVQLVPVDEDLQKRFEREVQVWSRVAHPRLGKVRMGRVDGDFYMATWPVVPLKPRLARPVGHEQALRFIQQLAEGMTHLHQHGVMHCALSPSALFLDDEDRLTIGFPLEPLLDRVWHTGQGSFRANYLAPELLTSGRRQPSVDQYQAGLLAYRLLTGRLPFDKAEPMAVIMAHFTEAPPDPREFTRDLSDRQALALLRALEKDPKDRFASVADFASALLDR
ncbi:MAG: protein kinase [Vulcanimicrobiota bacterium]